MKKSTSQRFYFILFNLLISIGLFAQDANLAGEWNGAIKIPGMDLEINLNFEKEGKKWKGDLDIPLQRIKDMALADLKVSGKNISFSLPEVPGNAQFKGALQTDEQAIIGDFMQGGATLVLDVRRESADDRAKLAAAIEKIKQLTDSAIIKAKVPGVGFGIVKDGEIILAEGFGVKNMETKAKVTANTQFAIGSSSKAFTTMGLALLEDEGLLDWDAPVRKYIPEFEMHNAFASEEMTPVDLVCHRSGLPRHDFLWYGSSFSRQELLEKIKYLEPSAPFRTKFQYQNLMFMTAGVVTERISGKTWESFIGNQIFRVLGMDDSNFSVDRMQESADYSFAYDTRDEVVTKIPYRNIDQIGPAGSINSTVNDMLKWVQLHLNDGKVGDKRLVSSKNLKKMHSPHKVIESFAVTNFPQFHNPSYGMGWFIYDYDGTMVVQHGGNIDGFSAMVYLMPEENIGMVILTNLNGNALPMVLSNAATDILLDKEEIDWYTLIYGDKSKKEEDKKAEDEPVENRVEGTSPSHDLVDYAGDYEDEGYGTLKIMHKDNKLSMQYNSFDLPLTHWHYDVFKAKDTALDLEIPIHFQMDVDGSIIQVNIPMEPAVDAISFVKKAPNELNDSAFLEKLTGDYDADGLFIKVSLQGKKLMMAPAGQPTFELIPYKGTSFKPKGLNGFVVDFKMGKNVAKEMILNQPNGVFVAKRK